MASPTLAVQDRSNSTRALSRLPPWLPRLTSRSLTIPAIPAMHGSSREDMDGPKVSTATHPTRRQASPEWRGRGAAAAPVSLFPVSTRSSAGPAMSIRMRMRRIRTRSRSRSSPIRPATRSRFSPTRTKGNPSVAAPSPDNSGSNVAPQSDSYLRLKLDTRVRPPDSSHRARLRQPSPIEWVAGGQPVIASV